MFKKFDSNITSLLKKKIELYKYIFLLYKIKIIILIQNLI